VSQKRRTLPVATCGGTQDLGSTEQIQMEQEHGRPCKFPFYYQGKEYTECTEVDSGGVGAWCRVEFPTDCPEFPPGDCKKGDIRWGICNPDGKECAENPTNKGKGKARSSAMEKVEEQLLLLENFFTWSYWEPIALCSMTLLFFSEVVGPFLDKAAGGFYVNGLVFSTQMAAFFLVAAVTNSPTAAASAHILALSTLSFMAGIAVLIMMLIMAVRGSKDKWARAVVDDISECLRPFSRGVVAFLLVYGIVQDVNTDWAFIAAFGGLFVFGVAMATTSLVSDFIAYVFIRMNHWFTEGDLIYYQGGLHEVQDIHWRFTQTMAFANRCKMYIPNGKLGNAELVNQSQDFGRMVIKNIPLPPHLSGAALEGIVTDIWALIKALDGKKFKGLNGETYDNQVDVAASSVVISDNAAATSAKELSQVTLTVKLKALFSYSTPPPFTGEGEVPDARDRQWDWLGPWNAQQERVLIDVQKVLDKHASGSRKA
jgi:small-conductance mechanosensitive channel